tara:strand:- start:15019 stop:15639 length:621 start_codon:yes stop_codon:yes gene_type:complete
MNMQRFETLTGVAAPLLRANVDTDAIIPSREMKRVSKHGLGDGLFAGWRYLPDTQRQPNPDFVLNQAGFERATILLSGPNFGCGSSREHAVWALKEYGIRAIIAPGFGSIFANNCVRNGLLPLVLPETAVRALADWVETDPVDHPVVIDLVRQQVIAGDELYQFEVEAGARRMLMEGLDAIALTQTRSDVIKDFHEARQRSRPWLY